MVFVPLQCPGAFHAGSCEAAAEGQASQLSSYIPHITPSYLTRPPNASEHIKYITRTLVSHSC
ncbi:hypothetical protein E2C01_054224 [Portunus trituberculatus]|uniref:Uncharacterized protein n=1 Tax=Portunus trituberculatus TaxID=210409 RepID=A0A5B7GRD5_PORTR|nr:hypothetical protein [Portunus trituberculatus]